MGKWERTVLRAAAEKGRKKELALPPPDLSNKQMVAVRRAVASLEAAQLIGLLRDDNKKVIEKRIYSSNRGGRRRLARRERYAAATRLGHAVAEACAVELREAKPIRWTQRLPTVRRAILDECGCLPPDQRQRHS